MIVDRDGDFNFALATCAPAVMALLLLSFELLDGRLHLGFAIPCLVVVAVFLGATAYFMVEQAHEDRFRAWLLRSVAAIERGSANPQRSPIGSRTRSRAGWWSWFGIIQALLSAYRNLRGGTPITVAQYHAELLANGTASRMQR